MVATPKDVKPKPEFDPEMLRLADAARTEFKQQNGRLLTEEEVLVLVRKWRAE